MATAAKQAAAEPTSPVRAKSALTKLKEDHSTVRKMFDEYEASKDKMTGKAKANLVATICGELKVHTQVEEEIFYPALRAVQTKELEELLDEAEVEHGGAKDLVAQLEAASPNEPLYDAKVTVLGEQVKHHAREEENEMFPEARKTDVDMNALGAQLIARAEELKRQMGLS